MKRILFILTMAITAFFGVMVHGQTIPTGQPQRVQHPYYQYDGFIEAKGGILLSRRVANFTPKSPALIYDTVTGKVSVYLGGWKSLQNVAFTADYNDLINRPDLTQYVPTSRTINGYSLTSNVTINNVDIGLGNVQNVDVTNAGNITSGTLLDARLSANVTLQGNAFNGANQLLQLDAGGKVAYANLPAALMIYKGVWDASSNTPTLTDGTGVNGWVYRVHPGGTVNFGSGSITFSSGDYVIYNGSVWQKSGGGDAVTSVNGQQGVVVLSTANIAEGGTNYYYTNTRVQTYGDTRYSLLNHEHVYSDIANLSSYTGFDVRYKSISYVPAWSDITSKPTFATVATSGAYNDLSGTPSLGSLAALSTIGNAYITDVAWSKITGPPSFLTTETDPTIYAWAKASVKPSYTYAEIGGTIPTWNQNTTGNAATATTATNWGVVPNSLNSPAEASGLTNLIGVHSNTYAYKFTAGAVQSFLGLGSNAYTSTAFLPLSAGSSNRLTGDLFITNGYYFRGRNTGNTGDIAMIGIGSSGSVSPNKILIDPDNNGTQFGGSIIGTIGSFNSSLSAPHIVASSAMYLRYNGSYLYGRNGADNAYIPLIRINGSDQVSIDNNGVGTVFGGGITAISFSGAGTGLTGAASNLTAGYIHNRYWSTDANNIWQSGVYTFYNGTNVPGGDFGMISIPVFSGADGSNRYNLQIGAGLSGDPKYRITNINGAGTWYTLLSAYNYNSYSPTLTGTGASGTWSISITGNAGSVAWSNVTSRPTTVSAFTNDAGYITSAVTSIAGTTNQIAVSASTGAVTVSLTNNVVIPGTITSSASYESSDRRLKKPLTGTRLIGRIESLQARLYEKDGRDEYGYYAQEALTIIPTAVKQRADGYYDLSYTQVFVVKIASLEKRVLELETLLEKIYGK